MQTEKIIEHIVNWLKTYSDNSKTSGFVLGVSGGLDSAVVSTLCAKTGLPTLCVEMPIHQVKTHIDRADEHLKYLQKNFKNVQRQTINLTSVFDNFTEKLPVSKNSDKYDLALANSRARLRMTTLYYFAGIYGYLVAGTGNKIEDFGVGFFTKYGDGGVDISPIGDLMKSDVYKLAEKLQIPESIVKAVPTDGLFGDDRTDEEQLGATYDELEWAMKKYLNGHSNQEFKGRKKEVFLIFQRLHLMNQHKINAIPICKIPESLKKI